MKKFEYSTELIDSSKGVFGGKIDADGFEQMLNAMGREGWELVSLTDTSQAYGSSRNIVCVFKRELA